MGLVFSRYFYHLPFNRFVHSLRLPHLFVFGLPCLFLPLLLFVLSIFPIFFDNYWKNGFGIFCELLWMIFTFFILQHTVRILPILCFPHPLPSTNFLFKCLPYLTKLVSFLGPTKSSSFAGWMQLPQRCCVFLSFQEMHGLENRYHVTMQGTTQYLFAQHFCGYAQEC